MNLARAERGITGGRPTRYKPELIDELLEFFDVELSEEKEITFSRKDGSTVTKFEVVATDLPTLAGFCRHLGIARDTLTEWQNKHPEFSSAVRKCKEIQEEHVVINALQNRTNPVFSIFFAKNNLGYKDKQEVDQTLIADVTSNGETLATKSAVDVLIEQVKAKSADEA